MSARPHRARQQVMTGIEDPSGTFPTAAHTYAAGMSFLRREGIIWLPHGKLRNFWNPLSLYTNSSLFHFISTKFILPVLSWLITIILLIKNSLLHFTSGLKQTPYDLFRIRTILSFYNPTSSIFFFFFSINIHAKREHILKRSLFAPRESLVKLFPPKTSRGGQKRKFSAEQSKSGDSLPEVRQETNREVYVNMTLGCWQISPASFREEVDYIK